MPRTKKAPKDTNAPKKPQTAYFLFSNKRRPILKEENKDKKVTEIAKMIGQEWKQLSEEEKKVYVEEAAKARAEYKLAFEAYQKTDNYQLFQKELAQWKIENEGVKKVKGKGGVKKIKLPKKPKDEKAPKKPMSSYFLFSNKRRPELKEQYPEKKVTEFAKMIGAEWKTMADDAKKPFQDQANKIKQEYEVAFAKYKESDDYATHLSALNEWKKAVEEAKQQQRELERNLNRNVNSHSHKKHKKRRRSPSTSSSSGSDSDSSSGSDSDSSSGSYSSDSD